MQEIMPDEVCIIRNEQTMLKPELFLYIVLTLLFYFPTKSWQIIWNKFDTSVNRYFFFSFWFVLITWNKAIPKVRQGLRYTVMSKDLKEKTCNSLKPLTKSNISFWIFCLWHFFFAGFNTLISPPSVLNLSDLINS